MQYSSAVNLIPASSGGGRWKQTFDGNKKRQIHAPLKTFDNPRQPWNTAPPSPPHIVQSSSIGEL